MNKYDKGKYYVKLILTVDFEKTFQVKIILTEQVKPFIFYAAKKKKKETFKYPIYRQYPLNFIKIYQDFVYNNHSTLFNFTVFLLILCLYKICFLILIKIWFF